MRPWHVGSWKLEKTLDRFKQITCNVINVYWHFTIFDSKCLHFSSLTYFLHNQLFLSTEKNLKVAQLLRWNSKDYTTFELLITRGPQRVFSFSRSWILRACRRRSPRRALQCGCSRASVCVVIHACIYAWNIHNVMHVRMNISDEYMCHACVCDHSHLLRYPIERTASRCVRMYACCLYLCTSHNHETCKSSL